MIVQCKICNGSGLIKTIPEKCNNIKHNEKLYVCSFCENTNKTFFKTCDICCGVGKIKILI